MIIWRGWGVLAAIIAFLALVLMQLVADGIFGPETYSQNTQWWAPVGLLLAALVIWPLGRSLNNRGARMYVDRENGQEVTVRPNHSLFFIRMEYWAAILAGVAIVVLVYGLLRAD